MAGRRAGGEGSVFQLPDGRWAASLELPRHPNGRRNRRKREARTQAEAQALLKQMRRDVDDFGSLPKLGRRVADTLDDYIDHVLTPRDSRWKTAAREESFSVALRGFFGEKKTADLSVRDCDAFLVAFANGQANASAQPVGRDYVRRARSYLIAALLNDMRLGYINRNVADLSVIPKTTKKTRQRRALTVDEWRRLYDNAKTTTRLSIDLSGRHGLRPQEARSIRWSDVDLEEGTLSVVTQFDSHDEFVDPKTVDSTRTIKLHPETIEGLGHWRVVQAEQQQRSGERWSDRDLVITTRNGTAISQENSRRSLRTLCDKLGIPAITPYELRHTAITHQVDRIGSAGPVADWAGTSETMIRKHYRHKLREVIRLAPPSFEAS